MSRKTLSAIMLSLLVISTLALASKIQSVKADVGTITINADGSISPSNAPIYTADNITYTLTGNIRADADGIVIERDNIVLDGAGYTVTGNRTAPIYCGINLANMSNVTVNNMTIENFPGGIYLGSSENDNSASSNNSIVGNNITNNGDGISLDYNSFNNSVSGNNITNNGGDGIYLYDSSSNGISGNNITNNGGDGILLEESSSDNSISGNNITNNVDGIYLAYRDFNNSISGNNITNSSNRARYPRIRNGDGIYLYDSSSNGISGNNITNNVYGIYFDVSDDNTVSGNYIANNGEGVYFSDDDMWPETVYISESSDSIYQPEAGSGNTVYHNNFVNNSNQAYSNFSANVWDDGYPSGGNYWSDYNGTDIYKGILQNESGNDGIGDTPYVIGANNTDSYPLMSPYPHLVGDVNGDGKVNYADLTLLAYAYHSKRGDPNWNPLADLAAPYGIISLTDLVTMALHYGRQYP